MSGELNDTKEPTKRTPGEVSQNDEARTNLEVYEELKQGKWAGSEYGRKWC